MKRLRAIAAQSRDRATVVQSRGSESAQRNLESAQRNLEIAQIPGLRGTQRGSKTIRRFMNI